MSNLIVRQLGRVAYATSWQAMQRFTRERNQHTTDELWLLEHDPVFTQGQAGREEHVLDAGNIPLVRTDRGGQVTYHGPGQLMIYTLLNIKRLGLNVRQLVTRLEQVIINTLAQFAIAASARADAPGVYIDQAKICSIGLRVKRGFCYHGLAFNVAMDLAPFARINPCGYRNLTMTQLNEQLTQPVTLEQVEQAVITAIFEQLHYQTILYSRQLPEEQQ